MIIKGNPAGSVSFWSSHLLRDDTNERAEVVEMKGLLATDLPTGLREMQAVASGSRSEGNFMYCANINPRDYEHLTPEQWQEAVDTLERNLGLGGHQRIVVEHEKEGRIHRHIVWNRVDVDTMRVADMGQNWRTHDATSRELEGRFGLEPTPHTPALERTHAALELWEIRAAERSGIAPAEVREELTQLWRASDSGQDFANAIEGRGYMLAKGDRRDFVVIDQAGDVHSLARRLDGVRAAEVRDHMADVDRDGLPSVIQARALQHERAGLTVEIEQPPDQEPARTEGNVAVPDRLAPIAAIGEAPFMVIDGATGIASKLGDFVCDLLSGGPAPRPDPMTFDGAMQERAAQRQARAAMERIADSIEAGENLKGEDIAHLHPSQLENIRLRGDDAVRAIIESMERQRELERDYGRTRER